MTPRIGGGTNDRPKTETLAETGPGLPDEAVGPEQRTLPELNDLADAPEAERLARRLTTEAERFEDEGGAEDPTGHA